MSPSDFWRSHPSEFWWIAEEKRRQAGGGMTKEEKWADLYEALD